MQEGTAARTTGKKVRPPKMPEPDDFTLIYDGKDIYLAADGVKIANHIPRSLPGPFGVVAICAHQRISGLEVNQWQRSFRLRRNADVLASGIGARRETRVEKTSLECKQAITASMTVPNATTSFLLAYSGQLRWLICAFLIATGLLPVPVIAANEKGKADCAQIADIERQIAGCTRFLNSNVTKNLRASAYNNRGSAWFGKGDFDRAIADYNESIRLAPKWALPYNNRGVAWNGKGEFDRAIADYNEAIRLAPKYAEAYNGRGVAFHDKGNFDRAFADYNEAIRLDPKWALPYNNRANAFGEKGEFDRAIKDYNEAIRLDPKWAFPYNGRGLAFYHMGEFDRAISDYNEAIRLDPKYAQPYFNRGNAWRLKGDLDRALADQDEAIRLDPRLSR